ncbi:MAG: hypothetical protein JXA23_00960 [Bacteroidales bacterium]|nr:hypothetical protein [Bacteroidales bacterium]
MKTGNLENRKKIPRRRFFRKLMQGVIGTGLAVTGGYLLLEEENEENCQLEHTCSLCGKATKCGFPAAISYREYLLHKQENQ